MRIRSAVTLAITLASLTACGVKVPKSKSVAKNVAKSDAGAPATAFVQAPAPPSPTSPLGTSDLDGGAAVPLVWSPSSAAPPARPGPMTDQAVMAWYADRGALLPTDFVAPECHEIKVGPSNAAALFCHVTTNRSTGRPDVPPIFVKRAVVRTVSGSRVVTLFDQPWLVDFGTSPDEEPRGPLFALTIDFGLSEIVVRETTPGACAEAQRTLHDELEAAKKRDDKNERAAGIAEAKTDERARADVCAAAGRYAWAKNRFAKMR